MNFPLFSAIEPETYGPTKTGTILKIDGNAGAIPPQFQCAVTTSDETGNQLCDQGVVPMTDKQWDEWLDQENAEYILDCMAANLELTRIKPVNPPARAKNTKTGK